MIQIIFGVRVKIHIGVGPNMNFYSDPNYCRLISKSNLLLRILDERT